MQKHTSTPNATLQMPTVGGARLTRAAAISSSKVGSRRFSSSRKKNPFMGTSLKRFAPNTSVRVCREGDGPSGHSPAVALLAKAVQRPSSPPCLASASLSFSWKQHKHTDFLVLLHQTGGTGFRRQSRLGASATGELTCNVSSMVAQSS